MLTGYVTFTPVLSDLQALSGAWWEAPSKRDPGSDLLLVLWLVDRQASDMAYSWYRHFDAIGDVVT